MFSLFILVYPRVSGKQVNLIFCDMISAIMGSPTFGQVSQLLNEADYKAGGCFDKKQRWFPPNRDLNRQFLKICMF